jgi:hypothetical protein
MPSSSGDVGGPLQPLTSFIEGIARFPGQCADSLTKVLALRKDFSVKSLEDVMAELAKLRFEPGVLRTSIRAFLDHPTPEGLNVIQRQIEKNAPVLNQLDHLLTKNKYAGARDHKSMDIIRQVGRTKLGLYDLIGGQHALNRYVKFAGEGKANAAQVSTASRRQLAKELERLFDETNLKIDEARDRLASYIKSQDADRRGT